VILVEWLSNLAPRERLLVATAAGLGGLFLIYAVAWRPMVQESERLRQVNAQQRSDLAWMRSAAREVELLRRNAPHKAGRASGSLLGTVDALARQAQVKDRIRRIQPDGDRMVRVEMDAVDFNRLIGWLGRLTSQGIETSSLSLTRVEGTHEVEARLTLERGQE
jgi:general secretion pathway protein M